MKKIIILATTIALLLASCGGTKKTKNAIASGDYEAAFNNAIAKLNKDKNKYDKQIPLLKEAFDKEVEKDLAKIKQLEKQNPKNYKAIYNEYMSLDTHQDEIILLEPLYFEGKQVKFDIKDYSSKIAFAKDKYSENLYNQAQPLIYGSKTDSRKAISILEELQYVNPNYRTDLSTQIATARKRASDYIFVKLHNSVAHQLQDSTSQSILKNFSKIRDGNFENKWIVLHDKKDPTVVYDYEANIYLDKITATPEKTNQQAVHQEKEIITGYNVKTTTDGKEVKTPIKKLIKADLMLYQQIKTTTLDGKVIMKNLKTGTTSNAAPIKGEAKLENIYGTYTGDPKAIEQKYHKALQTKRATFPSDGEFNKFALQTFKIKVEELLAKQKY